jgi:hypothetical protein
MESHMHQELIFIPAVALVALTLCVWILLYRRRIGAMRAHRVNPEKFKTRSTRVPLEEAASASDNFQNLLELPLLFYVLVLALYATQRVDDVYLALAWGFVALRIVHSLVHVTYNRVMHRFAVYISGGVLLFAAWARFGWSLVA